MSDFLPLVLYALMGFMIIGSLIAIQTADLLSAVISVGAVGFGLALVDLFLGAPDLALTQVVVEILVLVMLIRLVVQRKDPTEQQPPGALLVSMVMMLLGIALIPIIHALNDMAPFGEPLFSHGERVATLAQDYIRTAIERTGATNLVTAVLLDFRSFDTLGEATVIFASIIGAYSILRKVGRIRGEKDDQ